MTSLNSKKAQPAFPVVLLSNGRVAYGFETRAETFGQRQGSEAARQARFRRHVVIHGYRCRLGGLRISTAAEVENKTFERILCRIQIWRESQPTGGFFQKDSLCRVVVGAIRPVSPTRSKDAGIIPRKIRTTSRLAMPPGMVKRFMAA